MKRRGSHLASSVMTSLSPGPSKVAKTDTTGGVDRTMSKPEEALQYLKSLFPVGVFNSGGGADSEIPAIVMKHQLYSILRDRTSVDRDIQAMCESGLLRMFKLGISEHDYALMYQEEYSRYVKSQLGDTPLSKKFLNSVLQSCPHVSITRDQLTRELRVSEQDISSLVKGGVLLLRDVGKSSSWWFAVPQVLQRSKFKEVLRHELESRKLSVSKLNMEYHIHDVIGADIVECIETTSGPLLRLVVDN